MDPAVSDDTLGKSTETLTPSCHDRCMGVVCHRFEERLAAGTVSQSLGAVAQLAERHDGIVEVRGSIPLSSTLQIESDSLAFMLGGLVAGEGPFHI